MNFDRQSAMFLITVSAIFFANSGLAVETGKVNEGSVSAELRPEHGPTSMQDRADKKYLLTIVPAGSLGLGVMGGYYIRPDFIIQVGANHMDPGVVSLKNFDDKDDKDDKKISLRAKLRKDTFLLNGKKFFGNSFYTQAGIGYQQLKVSGTFEGSGYQTSLEKNRVLGEISIGNQWQFNKVTLGCDWFGVLPELYSNTKKSEISENATKDEKNEAKNLDNIVEFISSTSFLKLYVGVSI